MVEAAEVLKMLEVVEVLGAVEVVDHLRHASSARVSFSIITYHYKTYVEMMIINRGQDDT